MTTDEEFLDDDNRIDVYALFILEDNIPQSMINEVLSTNAASNDGEHYLWPADTYSTLPRLRHWPHPETVRPPIDPNWRSLFIGKTLQQPARFVRNAPKPLCRTFFAVLERERYERDGCIRVCKVVSADGVVQSFFYNGDEVALYIEAHDRDTWEETWRSLREE
ncbi:hypothetical protein M409DRAFT_19183 [Zasmidium cellare ATCC 36951]|uniref:Uncharacterized protein n=1 Tax=Zasmidium cellare ATCC 36951 TaxID=1080233 RepID=A0A6A6CUH5_ZASCE|nr:uncharacterized protein M409DRAFT_19183 [Zasmidium cellare ATCC 36951]KAF2170363.1 hypothetical protein M409DRAFT_19183 [Zasmidium cellare ATCC 36951]